MRIHSLIIIGLLALPAGSRAQGIRLPRPGQRTPVQPAEPPPEIPVVARALSVQRSRWTTEAYTLMSSVRIPATAAAGVTSYSTLGTGTRADYRISDRWSATMDMTASMFGGPINETAEVGTRFSPLLWEPDTRSLRPFFDVRAAYMHMYDSFVTPAAAVVGGAGEQFSSTGRYSRGFGAAAGAGMEFGITPTIAVTTEFSALRNNMLIYHLTTTSSLPAGDHYMMTSYRMAVGIKYNPLRTLDLKQNPR
jgi:hypothetical protein